MATFVLIPGVLHGGWWYRPITEGLRAAGHEVHPVTLTGVSERGHLNTLAVDLETHIQDVLGLLEAERITDAVLVPHSYGGMVASGVADRAPERIAGLVYADAFVPRDGESAYDIVNDVWKRRYLAGAAAGGGRTLVGLNPALDPRATVHPLATLLQPVRLSGAADALDVPRVYLHAERFEDTPFLDTVDRLRNDPAWTVHTLLVGHDLVREAPEEFLEFALTAAPEKVSRRPGNL
ncbi:Pimeloyl-ACP methyl ester carboxylesterase [Streptomyces sp. TLI_053]|uniref:alpha/beta fold hydrolase n=1 Tax=Streptomyces sp. TLI_053 TaxID=1855352 RepID=UPI00087B015B|nr:alpha/beta hydrolase [Streptomyces sp. TLI_053]SDT74874.1 Pimeloyl-ACP methyl ester carboxylesterase [Streptomyces sp. TLI_053]